MKPCTYEKHKLISFTSSNGTITSYLCCWFSRIKKNAFSLCPVWLASVASYRGWGIWGMASASTQSAQKKIVLFWNTSIVNTRLGCKGTICLSFSFVIAVQKLPMVDIMSIYIGGEGVQNLQSRGYLSRAFMWKEAVLWTRVVQAKLKANVGAMNPFIFGSWWFESLRKRLGIQEYSMM